MLLRWVALVGLRRAVLGLERHEATSVQINVDVCFRIVVVGLAVGHAVGAARFNRVILFSHVPQRAHHHDSIGALTLARVNPEPWSF